MNPIIKIKRLSSVDGKLPALPKYQSDGAAALDLRFFSDCPISLAPFERQLFPTGICIELPDGFAALIFARSGLASRYGIALSNGVGLIDSDYRGEIKVGLVNISSEQYTVMPDDRIAQLMIIPAPHAAIFETSELSHTSRGDGGFGSTGRR